MLDLDRIAIELAVAVLTSPVVTVEKDMLAKAWRLPLLVNELPKTQSCGDLNAVQRSIWRGAGRRECIVPNCRVSRLKIVNDLCADFPIDVGHQKPDSSPIRDEMERTPVSVKKKCSSHCRCFRV